MHSMLPRVAAVHDLSCVGRCSLTVIIPVLSALGIQVCPLPTAILSTHLGGFRQVAFCDFTDRMADFYRHWQEENITFDCIYTGFLASAQQIDVVSAFIDNFAFAKPLIVVDPVMGDEGKLYSVYTPEMQEHMKKLICKADVITPNYTEACFLLGEAYEPDKVVPAILKEWLIRLTGMGPSKAVITGIPGQDRKIMNLAYDANNKHYSEVSDQHIPVRYPGTGDIFAALLAGALLQGKTLEEATRQAAGFVSHCVALTCQAGSPTREGVLLEMALPALWNNNQEVSTYEGKS